MTAESQCPFCATTPPIETLLQHLQECAAHPALRKADAMEAARQRLGAPRLELAGRLRGQADRARIATARLLEYVEAFKGTWGEDERCRATVPRWAEPGWYAAIKAARESLEALEGEKALA